LKETSHHTYILVPKNQKLQDTLY